MDKTKHQKETLLAIILLLLGGAILWNGYSYEPDSRQFPLFLGWLFIVFSVLNLGLILRKGLPSFDGMKVPVFSDSVFILALVCGYAVAIPFIGYYAATFLFLILVMFLFGRKSKTKKSLYLLTAAAFLCCVYVFFTLILGTQLPVGELFAGLGA